MELKLKLLSEPTNWKQHFQETTFRTEFGTVNQEYM